VEIHKTSQNRTKSIFNRILDWMFFDWKKGQTRLLRKKNYLIFSKLYSRTLSEGHFPEWYEMGQLNNTWHSTRGDTVVRYNKFGAKLQEYKNDFNYKISSCTTLKRSFFQIYIKIFGSKGIILMTMILNFWFVKSHVWCLRL